MQNLISLLVNAAAKSLKKNCFNITSNQLHQKDDILTLHVSITLFLCTWFSTAIPSIIKTLDSYWFNSVDSSDWPSCKLPSSSIWWSIFDLSVHAIGSPSDVKSDRGTTENSKFPKQCSRSISSPLREVIKNLDGKGFSSWSWITLPSTFFRVTASCYLKVFNFLFVILSQVDFSPCILEVTNSSYRFFPILSWLSSSSATSSGNTALDTILKTALFSVKVNCSYPFQLSIC